LNTTLQSFSIASGTVGGLEALVRSMGAPDGLINVLNTFRNQGPLAGIVAAGAGAFSWLGSQIWEGMTSGWNWLLGKLDEWKNKLLEGLANLPFIRMFGGTPRGVTPVENRTPTGARIIDMDSTNQPATLREIPMTPGNMGNVELLRRARGATPNTPTLGEPTIPPAGGATQPATPAGDRVSMQLRDSNERVVEVLERVVAAIYSSGRDVAREVQNIG
jgi:hypothetical protein